MSVEGTDVNLLIACPAYGGMTYVTHNESLTMLAFALTNHQVKFDIKYIANESLIPRARNRFATMALGKNRDGLDYSHLLFLDTDIGFSPQDIISLIAVDKDIAALPYTAKCIDWKKIVRAVKSGVTDGTVLSHLGGRPIINTNLDDTTFNISEPVQFPQLGTGLLLIKRKVLQKFADDPERQYKLMPGERASDLDQEVAYDIFRIGINSKTRYYDSEDYRFCLDAREMGFETFLLPWAITSHTGPQTFIMDIPGMASHGISVTVEPDEVPPAFTQPTSDTNQSAGSPQ